MAQKGVKLLPAGLQSMQVDIISALEHVTVQPWLQCQTCLTTHQPLHMVAGLVRCFS